MLDAARMKNDGPLGLGKEMRGAFDLQLISYPGIGAPLTPTVSPPRFFVSVDSKGLSVFVSAL